MPNFSTMSANSTGPSYSRIPKYPVNNKKPIGKTSQFMKPQIIN
jgi:hypothetical protein